jgi:Glycosyl hydrolases family 25
VTVYVWDASNYDWTRDTDHVLNFRAARADGISGVTHKATEGHTYTDAYFDDFARLVNEAGIGFALVGPYHVAWPDDAAQWDHWFDTVDSRMPWWRDFPGVVAWQIDAEKFSGMPRAPSLAEIRAGADRIIRLGVDPAAIVVYAPQWQYGDTLRGLGYKLWASNYGTDPAVRYRQAYPGDTSPRWGAYSGITPALLQFGSKTIIGEQHTCDASAVRVANEADLQALFGGDMPLSTGEVIAIANAVWAHGILNPDSGATMTAAERVLDIEVKGGDLAAKLASLALAVGKLAPGNVDVPALAAALAADLGPDLGNELVAALGAALGGAA